MGLGFRVQAQVQGSRLRVYGLGSLGFRVTALSGLGIRGFGVQGSGPFVKCFFRVEGSKGTFSERKGLQKEWKPFSKDPTGGFR